MVFMQKAIERSDELIRWARHYPIVYRWLEYFADSSDTVNFIMGHGLMLWAIFSYTRGIKGNPILFQMAGLSKEQIMAPPSDMPTMSNEELKAYAEAINGYRRN
jgi:hypothetical protein